MAYLTTPAATSLHSKTFARTVKIPAIVTGAVSIACIAGGSSVNVRRNAALATAYTLSETAFKEYQDKVVETIGEKKEKTVREEVHKEILEKNPIAGREIVFTGTGDVRCYDAWSGRYFMSDMNTLHKVVNELNERMINSFNSYVSLNEFYYKLGLMETKAGDALGWRLDGERRLIELSISSLVTPEDGVPCLVVDFKTRPHYDYDLSF